jgi:hypothetical protein
MYIFLFSSYFSYMFGWDYHRLPNNNLYAPPLRKEKKEFFVFVPNRHSLKAGPVRLLYSQYTPNMYQWGLFVVYPFWCIWIERNKKKKGGGFRIIYMSGHTDRNTAMNNPVWKHTNKPCTIAYLYINIVDGRMTPFYFLNSGSSVGGDPADRIDVVYYTPPNSKKYIKRKPRIYIKWIFSNITCFVRL